MKLSKQDRAYLIYKHRGGVNNQKGNTYECNYATKEIVRLFASGADVDTTLVGAQIPDAFVDDFCIIESARLFIYHQIKDKKKLSWGKCVSPNLSYDFKKQKTYSSAEKKSFKLKAVCSDENCKVVTGPIPAEIEDVTEVEYFPAYARLELMLLDSTEIQDNLRQIMNYPGDYFPLDMQAGCMDLIRSQWMELSEPGVMVPLVKIQEAYDRKHPGCPNFKTVSDVHLSKAAIEVLNKFPDFLCSVKGTEVFWRFRRMEGTLPVQDLEKALEEVAPQNIVDLLTILN